ncbi:hypothetical protein HY405_01925 [Candidatus Microgenomates bacterium]|nr:hypothetical protein [Candidatus Microgenomates bacterium]
MIPEKNISKEQKEATVSWIVANGGIFLGKLDRDPYDDAYYRVRGRYVIIITELILRKDGSGTVEYDHRYSLSCDNSHVPDLEKAEIVHFSQDSETTK